MLRVGLQSQESSQARDDKQEMGHRRSELKPYIESHGASRKECPNVACCSPEKDVIPERTDDATGTESPRTVPASEDNHGHVD